MKRYTALSIIMCLAIVMGLIAGSSNAKTTKCMEDMPCWNWATMGNHTRGLTLTTGEHYVVNRCDFADFWARELVPSSEHMKGDNHAIRYPRCKPVEAGYSPDDGDAWLIVVIVGSVMLAPWVAGFVFGDL